LIIGKSLLSLLEFTNVVILKVNKRIRNIASRGLVMVNW